MSPQHPHRAATFAVLVVAATTFALMQALVIPVLPEIQRVLETDQRNVAWVVSANLLSAAIAIPIVGRLGDAYGKKRMLIITTSVLSLGLLLAALAPNLTVMIVARILQGGAGGMMALSFGIVREIYPAERASKSIGILASLGGIGASLGLILAGPIVNVLGYRWLFLLPMIVSIIVTVVAIFVVPRSASRSGSISWLPAAPLTVALVCFILATTQATQWGWLDLWTLSLYAASLIAGAIWVRCETRVKYPLIDMQMMRIPAVRSANIVGFLLGFAMFGVYAYLPQLLQASTSTNYGFGASITKSGLVLLPLAAGVFIGGLSASRLVTRFGSRDIIVASCVVLAALLAVMAVAHQSIWGLTLQLAVYGTALGLCLATLSTLVVMSVPMSQSGVASGVNFNMRNIGGSVGTAVMATIVTARLDAAGDPLGAGYVTGFAVFSGVMVIAVIVAAKTPQSLASIQSSVEMNR